MTSDASELAPASVLNEYGFTSRETDELEALIDRRGIEAVLQQISDLCGLKADHIASNWQDCTLAKRWATVAGAVGVASTRATGL